MPYHQLSTTKIARAVGCHPNTVRLYEQWGFLQPAPRSPKGYRLYTPAHLAQMRLARTALNTAWPGRAIRRSAVNLIRQAARNDLNAALELAHRHLELVRSELAQAETAASLLERWAAGQPANNPGYSLHINDAARLLGLTTDTLRNWDRSGLVDVPRCSTNRYRLYGVAEISRLRIIRMLRSAGYSTMSILRMLTQLDHGEASDLRRALDTPAPGEDIYFAADRWLTTLHDQERVALKLIQLLKENIQQGTG